MAGMYSDPGDKHGGTGLPAGHWMHGVMAKEKARLAKKKAPKGKSDLTSVAKAEDAKPSSPASVQAVTETPMAKGIASYG